MIDIREGTLNDAEIIPVNANAVEAIERANIDIQIATARRYPMHQPEQLEKIRNKIKTFATIDEETAASCFYSLPRSGRAILGGSVRLAEIALTQYGNCRVQVSIQEVDTTSNEPHVVVQAIAHDLENNVALCIPKRRRITKKKDKPTIDEDDIQLAVNSCTSIAYRDATFKVIPQVLIKPIWQECRRIAIGDIKSLATKRLQVVDRLKQMGLDEKRIFQRVDSKKIEEITLDRLEELISLGTQLKEGVITLEEAFPIEIAEPLKQGVNAVKEKIKNESASEDPKQKSQKRGRGRPAKTKEQKQAEEEKVEEQMQDRPEDQQPIGKWTCSDCEMKGKENPTFDEPVGQEPNLLCPSCLCRNIYLTQEQGQ